MEPFQAILVITLLAWAADSVSGTTQELSTTTGDTVNISCLFGEGTLLYILWYYNDGSGAHNILKLDKGELNIAAEYANRASLHDDYSTLILKEITVADEGTFHCVVHRLGQTAVPHFTTKLNVFSLRPDTLPVISPCTRADESSSCSIHANQPFTLTCTLPNAYPVEDTELIWYQDGKHFPSIPEVTQNDDGTTDISRQIKILETANFTCNATYRSANGRDNTAVSVEARIIPPEDEPITPGKKMTSGHIFGMTIGIVLLVGSSLAIITCFIVSSKARDITNLDAENDQVTSAESDPFIGLSTQNGYNNGKVRTSPTDEPDFDRQLLALAKTIPVDKVNQLGKDLGFDAGEIERYVATNSRYQHVTFDGTLAMLRDWHKKQTKAKNALVDAGLGRLPGEFSPGEGSVDNSTLLPSSTMTQGVNVNRSDERRINDKEIMKLSEKISFENYTDFCVALGFRITYSNNILAKQQLNCSAAYEEILKHWSTRTDGFTQDLDDALEKADLGGLRYEYKSDVD